MALKKRLREELEETGLEASRLLDMSLHGDTTRKAWRDMEECVRKRADSNIKNFIENIFKARERLAGAKV